MLLVLALVPLLFAPPPLASAVLTLATPGDAVVTLTVNDSQLPSVTALDISVDGDVRTTVLMFGKVAHAPAYTALLHAVPAGKHDIVAQPSPYWRWPPGAAVPALTVAQAPQSIVIARAPALWVRADTIGTSTDWRRTRPWDTSATNARRRSASWPPGAPARRST